MLPSSIFARDAHGDRGDRALMIVPAKSTSSSSSRRVHIASWLVTKSCGPAAVLDDRRDETVVEGARALDRLAASRRSSATALKIVAAEPHAGPAGPGPALPRRRLHPADHRSLAAGPQDLRHQPRRGRVDAAAARRGGDLRRRQFGRDRLDRRAHRGRDGRGQHRLRGLRRRLEVPVQRRLHAAGRGDREPRLRRSGGNRFTPAAW